MNENLLRSTLCGAPVVIIILHKQLQGGGYINDLCEQNGVERLLECISQYKMGGSMLGLVGKGLKKVLMCCGKSIEKDKYGNFTVNMLKRGEKILVPALQDAPRLKLKQDST